MKKIIISVLLIFQINSTQAFSPEDLWRKTKKSCDAAYREIKEKYAVTTFFLVSSFAAGVLFYIAYQLDCQQNKLIQSDVAENDFMVLFNKPRFTYPRTIRFSKKYDRSPEIVSILNKLHFRKQIAHTAAGMLANMAVNSIPFSLFFELIPHMRENKKKITAEHNSFLFRDDSSQENDLRT